MTKVAVTASTRKRGVRVSAVITAAATFAAYGAVFGAAPPARADPTVTTFAWTGSPEQFTVPANVHSLTVSVAAASGGGDQWGHPGGSGGMVTAILPVEPGEVLSIVVGGKGTDGLYDFSSSPGGYGGGGSAGKPALGLTGVPGGGGGGGSFVFDVRTDPNVLLVAAGGGGGASSNGVAGGAGGSDGNASLAGPSDGTAGGPGTLVGGGAGGIVTVGEAPFFAGADGTGPATSPAALGEGGDGSVVAATETPYAAAVGGGGGGGGYYGGGGGGSDAIAFVSPGGGGSGFLISSATEVSTGTNSGNGFVTISYTPVAVPVRAQATPQVRPFRDVPEGAAFAPEINALHEAGVVNGYPGNLYKPRAALSRAAAAAFLYRQAYPGAGDAPTPATAPFADVPVTAKFSGDIAWLKAQHIATGYGDGAFRPDSPVSRAALAAFLYRRAHPGTTGVAPATAPFADVATDSRFAGDIAWAKTDGIAHGYRDGTFRPGNPATRQAAAAFLQRFAVKG